MSAPSSTGTGLGSTGRIVSMDQFRGYTVAGMFVVNFLGSLAVIHSILKHNNTYFSYADSIMPSFLFAAGFSYRLTTLKRLPQLGPAETYQRIIVRSLGLVLVSLVLYGIGGSFSAWDEMTGDSVREFVAELFKADLWEVLSIIGATQVLILPVIAARPLVRVGAMLGLSVLHVLLSYSFNYDFVYGQPNWMDAFWGAAGRRAWDGGAFGLLHWAVPMLAGSLVFDLVANARGGAAARRLIGWGVALMLVAYLASCLSLLYTTADRRSDQVDLASSPVLPPLDRLRGQDLGALLTTNPPFVEPRFEARNYWMMDKRIVSASFIWFSTGFALALYGGFILVCDLSGISVGWFRLLGQNPLAAYIIHHAVQSTVRSIVPKDSPLWWSLVGLSIFFGLTILFVRYLDRNKIFLRL